MAQAIGHGKVGMDKARGRFRQPGYDGGTANLNL